jgi:aarF domain-containing kinase
MVRETIERELGAPVDSLFVRFDDRPIAAASLAQVHRATLPDGREVAVKVQYPEVGALVRLDLRNLRFMVGEVAKREPSFDYRAIVEELARQIPLELDFVREAEMMRRVRENLRAMAGIVIPRPVEGLVSRRVLVSEFLEGERLLEGAKGLPAAEGERLARLVAGAFGHQVLIDGLFQADPHPGNLLLLPGGRVGLLDFGLTKELPDDVRHGFARLVVAAGDRDVPRILAAFRELGLKTKSDAPDAVLPLIELFFDPRELAPDRGTRFRERQSSALGRNPVEALPGDLILLGRVVGLLRGVSASLGTPLRPMDMLRPYAERLLAGAKEPEPPAAAPR